MTKNLTFSIAFLLSLQVSIAQSISFTDTAFLQALLKHLPAVDTDGNDTITQSEAALVTNLKLSNKGIKSAFELRYFSSLERLDLSFNQLDTVDISALGQLRYLNLNNNELRAMDFSYNPQLHFLSINENNIGHIHLDQNPLIDTLLCDHSHVHHMKLYKCTLLQYLSCSHNHLDSLNLVANPDLTYLDVHANFFKQIVGITGLSQLVYLDAEDGLLAQLDLSACLALKFFYGGSNPNLAEICINESQLQITQQCQLAACYFKDITANWSTTCGDVTPIEKLEKTHLYAYPNPSTGIVHFNAPVVKIFDAWGNLVLEHQKGLLEISLEQAPGWYNALSSSGQSIPFVLR